MRRHRRGHADRRPHRRGGGPPRRRDLLRHLRRRRRRHRPRRALLDFHARPRRRGDGDRRQAAQPVRRRRARRGRAGHRLQEKPRLDHWVNGGFFCFEPAVARLSTTTACSSTSRWRASPPRVSCAPSATRASGTAWTPTRTRSCSTTSGRGGEAPWAVWEHDRGGPGLSAALVTGAQGFAGAVALPKALLERGDEVVVLRPRRAGERLGARAAGIADEVEEVDGDLIDGELMAGHSTSRPDTSSTSPPQTIVGTARRLRCRPSTPTCAAPGRCSRPAASRRRRVVVASSDKAYGAHEELPYREDFALQPTSPYEPPRRRPT